MILSDDKISHLSHLILSELETQGLFPRDAEVEVLREIKRLILTDLQLDEEADAATRKKLDSYSRRLIEGSPEWNVLYAKFHEEEMRKRKKER